LTIVNYTKLFKPSRAYFKQDLQLRKGWQPTRQTGWSQEVWGRGPGRTFGSWRFYRFPHTILLFWYKLSNQWFKNSIV